MARPVEFDREHVLQKAMLLFWRQGYHKTSIRDLTEATRLQPGSLYGAFANKRALFLRSMDFYSVELERYVGDMLRGTPPPLDRIEHFFRQLAVDIVRDTDEKGCLLVNTLLETPADDAEILQHAARTLLKVEAMFRETLEEAAAVGELGEGQDAQLLARFLMTGIYGLRVYSRLNSAPAVLGQIVDGLLAVLRCPSAHDSKPTSARASDPQTGHHRIA